MVKRKNKFLSTILIIVGISISTMMPASAWGLITHEAIDSQLNHVPSPVKNYPTFTKGGGVGTDMFFFLPGVEYYSELAHTVRTADLPREMLKISTTGKQKAFSYGWLSHVASDPIGHKNYINPRAGSDSGSDSNKHTEVEIGVDANLVDTTSISFSIPYDIIQKAYKNIYKTSISYDTIYYAAKTEALAMYIEKDAIKEGLFDDLKNEYNDFQKPYQDSISYSKKVINRPSILPNVDLDTGTATTISILPSIQPSTSSKMRKDFRDTAIELLKNNIIDVPIEVDDINKEIIIKEPIVKNRDTYDNIKSKIKEKIKRENKLIK